MTVDFPELLRCAKLEYGLDRLFVVIVLGGGRAIPDHPGVLEWPGSLWVECA